MSDSVLVERRGAVQVITINRPQARNAVNAANSQERNPTSSVNPSRS